MNAGPQPSASIRSGRGRSQRLPMSSSQYFAQSPVSGFETEWLQRNQWRV